MYNSNRVTVQGGTQIEIPLLRSAFSSVGWFEGFDLLDTTPQDVLTNAAWAWKTFNAMITVDGTTMAKNDSPESIANLVRRYFDIARMSMEDQLGTALFNTGSDSKQVEGLRGAIDDGTVLATYGGIGSRTTTNSFWQPATNGLDTTTTQLTNGFLQRLFMAAVQGNNNPTIGITTKTLYNSLVGLQQPQQRFPTGPTAVDEQLASVNFTNILFNNVPVIEDSHCPASHFFWVNERSWEFYVHPSANFDMGEFQKPTNQWVFVAPIILMCGLACDNVRLNAKATALAA